MFSISNHYYKNCSNEILKTLGRKRKNADSEIMIAGISRFITSNIDTVPPMLNYYIVGFDCLDNRLFPIRITLGDFLKVQ